MIPKIIHYCWFGPNKPGALEQKCIESWKKILPDYEVKCWGNECLEMFDNKYFKQALEAKKWAFVSDYVRLYAIYNEGGVYFDTDEEAVKPLDEFLDHDFFIGSQRCGTAKGISPALFGAPPKSKIVKRLLDVYDDIEFLNEDGSYNMVTNPALFGLALSKHYGVKDFYVKKGRVKITDNAYIYPYTYFCTDNKKAYAIHRYSGSWKPAWSVREKFSFKIGKATYFFRKFKHKIKRGKDEPMPISKDEKIIFTIRTKKYSRFILSKKITG